MVAILKVMLRVIEMMPSKEITSRWYIVVLTVFLRRWKLRVDHNGSASQMLLMLVCRSTRVHQKRTHDKSLIFRAVYKLSQSFRPGGGWKTTTLTHTSAFFASFPPPYKRHAHHVRLFRPRDYERANRAASPSQAMMD